MMIGTKHFLVLGLGAIVIGLFVTQKYSLKDTHQNEEIEFFRGAEPEGITTNQKPWLQKATSVRRNLGFDKNAAAANDIEHLTHQPQLRRVTLHFKPDAECPTPYLKGRLSGPSIGMLKWTHEPENNVMHGHYNVPLAGLYFLEVNMIYCNNFGPEKDGGFDFKEMCVINPLHMRLTNKKSYLNVYEPSKFEEMPDAFWAHASQMQTSDEPIPPEEKLQNFTPLYTRYQPVACMEDLPECKSPTSLKRFRPYEVRWNLPQAPPNFAEDIKTANLQRVCLIGASHARVMGDQMKEHVRDGFPIHYFLARYPKEVTEVFLKGVLAQRCTKVVMSFGQWPASRRASNPWLFDVYEKSMRALIERVLGAISRDKIYIRAMHSLPIRSDTATCPPIDWRTPPVIDGYNSILSSLTKEYDIEYLDTRFLMEPMWDSCEDWNHYLGKAGRNEALYIIGKITGVL